MSEFIDHVVDSKTVFNTWNEIISRLLISNMEPKVDIITGMSIIKTNIGTREP